MTEIKLREPAAGSALRGGFVKWTAPGDTVEGVVTFVDLEKGSRDMNGNIHGLLQVYDRTVGDQGDDGFYRKIDLNKKGLLAEVNRCIRSGLQPGWHIRLTFMESLTSQKKQHLHVEAVQVAVRQTHFDRGRSGVADRQRAARQGERNGPDPVISNHQVRLGVGLGEDGGNRGVTPPPGFVNLPSGGILMDIQFRCVHFYLSLYGIFRRKGQPAWGWAVFLTCWRAEAM